MSRLVNMLIQKYEKNIFKAVQATATSERVTILTPRKNVSQLKNLVVVFVKLALYWSMVLVLLRLNAGKVIKQNTNKNFEENLRNV